VSAVREFLRDEWFLTALVGALLIGLVVFVIWAAHDAHAWSRYARAHGCVRVSERTTGTTMVMMQVGKGVLVPIVTPIVETTWQCRDGVTVIR
jgi:hypothetical protein